MIRFKVIVKRKDSTRKIYGTKEVVSYGGGFKGEQYFTKEGLCDLFVDVETEKDFITVLESINGCFSVIIQATDWILAAVDVVRSYPLFHWVKDDEIVVSDAIDVSIIDKAAKVNSTSLKEFVLCGYVLGEDTLLDGWKQIEAGEVFGFKNNKALKASYFRHVGKKTSDFEKKQHFNRLDEITENVFDRLELSAENKRIVIPLSGGYDSRYIAAILAERKRSNIVCFTYGSTSSYEVKRARKVAKALDLEWHLVRYGDGRKERAYLEEKFFDYCKYSFNYCSLPHIQEFLAIEELKSKGVLQTGDVIVPGFCGDLLGGSYIPKEYETPFFSTVVDRGIGNYILKKHFPNKLFREDRVDYRIEHHLAKTLDATESSSNTEEAFLSQNDEWFTKNKVAKFVVNALRLYEFFGLEWRMPLWDRELIEYWYAVPIPLKRNDKLYDRYLEERVFLRNGCNSEKRRGYDRQNLFLKIAGSIPFARKYGYTLYEKVKDIYIVYLNRIQDINAFETASGVFLEDLYEMGMPQIDYANVNAVLARWMIWKAMRDSRALSSVGDY